MSVLDGLAKRYGVRPSAFLGDEVDDVEALNIDWHAAHAGLEREQDEMKRQKHTALRNRATGRG